MEVTIEQAFQKSLVAHREGNLQEAERLYRIILQSEPLHPDVNHNLGVLAVSVNKTEAALPLFKIALESNPKIEQFWLSYIDALLKEKQLSTLKKVIEQARKQDISAEKLDIYESQLAALASESKPENIKSKEGQKQEGKVETPSEAELVELIQYYKVGNFSDTEKLALSLTKRFPKHHIAWKVLGVVLQETGRTRDSLVASQQSVQLGPQDPEAHNNLGLRLAELRRFEEAAESFKQVIALKPDYAPAHCNLGASLQELGTLEEAEISFRQAIALDPNYIQANLNLGVLCKRVGKFENAAEKFRIVLDADPNNQEARYHLGSTLENEAKLHYHEAFKRADTKYKLDSLELNIKKFIKKEIQIDEKIYNLLNKLSQSINKQCGFMDTHGSGASLPLINSGPCGLFAHEFYRLWELRFSNPIKIAAIMTKKPFESNHVLIKLPNGALFDGGNGIHNFDTYKENEVELVVMEKYDLEVLDKYAWGLIRSYTTVNDDFSTSKMTALIASYLDDIYKI